MLSINLSVLKVALAFLHFLPEELSYAKDYRQDKLTWGDTGSI